MERQEWLKFRQGKIGASDAPAIMNVSPWQTPYQKWEEKVFGVTQKENPAMRRGQEQERIIISWVEDKLNIKLDTQEIFTHPKINYMIATIDGFNHEKKIMVEVKCPMKKNYDKVPVHYMPQLQHQMEVTGLDGMYFVSHNGYEGVIFEVARDQEYIDTLLKEEEKFFQCMTNLVPPDNHELEFEERNQEWFTIADQLYAKKLQLAQLSKEKELLEEQLILLSCDRNSKAGNFQFKKIPVKGRVDYEKIPEFANVNLEVYRKKPSIQWRLTCKL